MDNVAIANNFSLLAKLMDVHGENSFKSKTYASAAFNIERLPVALCELTEDKIAGLKGIGSSTAKKIVEMIANGRLAQLDELIVNTPSGVLEMLTLKGLGPKKINTIWKEIGIESVGELLYACRENRLKLYKGFGEKTQQNVIDTIEFLEKHKGHHLYATAELLHDDVLIFLKELLPGVALHSAGAFARKNETIDALDFVITEKPDRITELIKTIEGIEIKDRDNDHIALKLAQGITIRLIFAHPPKLGNVLMRSTSSHEFFEAVCNERTGDFPDEEKIFENAGLPFIPAHLRDSKDIIQVIIANNGKLPALVEVENVKGLVHCHSNWSDGSNTLEEMAAECIKLGLEYMLITDHSKSAFYANGLTTERILAQHAQIDELNKKIAPFKIFKGVESDILNNGSLDYDDEVLAGFDIIIASIHSNFKMSEEQATERICTAISNKFTSILGHPTGRLLLSRNGYPLNIQKIFEHCKLHNVAIEINANPHRLDLDRKYIRQAINMGIRLSINPDAHATNTITQIKYGVITAQKSLMTAASNISSYSLREFEAFIEEQKNKRY